ncbi:MAG: hypothetical protein ABJH72_01135 [Reichenbachiella sp.]|uniref:hypothetical protein n=1 Tax=Reichenbachiella sp. TaxID=2184521 RepID=UPI003267D8BA
MKEEDSKNSFEIIAQQTQSVITIAYVFGVAVGMIFNFHKFSEFGINIFDYVDVFDFLIVPFADPKILLFTLVSLLVSYLLFKADLFWREKHEKSYTVMSLGWHKKDWYEKFRFAAFSGLFVYYLFIAANVYTVDSSEKIRKTAPINIRLVDNEIISGVLIGKTANILFLLKGDEVKAVPISSLVKEFDIK